MVKLDIIIPVYNAESYLENCIKSIELEDNKNVKVILVNDGSTDNSLKICEKLANIYSNILLINQENKGLSGARNTGLDYVSGDYVAFMDPDDAYEDEYIYKCMKNIEEYDYPDLAVTPYKRVYGEEQIINELFQTEACKLFNGVDVLKMMYGMSIDEVVNPSKINDLSTAWGKFYRRELLKEKRFVDTWEIGSEDLLFNINVMDNVKDVLYIPSCYYLYTKTNTKSLTKNYNENLVNAWQKLFLLMEEQAKEKGYTSEYFDRLNIRKYLSKLSLVRVIFNSKNLSIGEKIRFSKRVVSTPEYNRYTYKDFPNMILRWKCLMWLCDNKCMYTLYAIIRLLEPYKNKLK